MLENKFQSDLIKELKEMFPGCVVLKNDPNYIQGFPDLTILYFNKWAVLECKKSEDEPYQPNQPYYVDKLDNMSFSRFIYPENKEEVLYELQQAFQSRRTTRISRRI
jgi:3-hydroxymyristoyl/3-hydroxydecanoyl-(acyl carrier protein) dehydratase